MTDISHETIEKLFYQQIRALTLYGNVKISYKRPTHIDVFESCGIRRCA